MTAPVELFFWPTPNCWKVSIALEEMGLPYLIRPVAIDKGEQFGPEFLALSPNNRVPAIRDPDGPEGMPVSLFESGAILQYLGRKTGSFYPTAERARAEVDQWLFWQVGGVGPMFGQAGYFRIYAPRMVDDPLRLEHGAQRYGNEMNRLLGVLDRRLAGRDFVAESYSIADVAIYPWVVTAARIFGEDLGTFARVSDWVDRMGARPAVERGMAAGAELRQPPPAPGSEEQQTLARTLFGQTAASVAHAAAMQATGAP